MAALVWLSAGPAHADITLNLKDADINTLIATVSDVTGKNFIVDSRVRGKVTVISASPMNSDSLYETFLAVLQVNGFAAIPSGGAIKIVPDANVKWEGGAYTSDGTRLARDEVVTHVFQLQNVSASQLVPILRPLMPQWAHLAAYQPNNTLIVADRAANVARIGNLIRQMDQAGDRDIENIKLQFASAADVVRTLTTMTQQDKQADPASKPATIIADERSNSILIGGDKADRARLIAIVRQLDVELPEGGSTQVVYLRYASAENLAPILEGYAQQVKQQQQRSAGATATAAPAATSSASGGGNGDARVLADKDTNALIITAPPKAMRQIRDVIAQLDIRRAQVLVEGIVAEVSANKQKEIGVDWVAYDPNHVAAAGILNSSTQSALSRLSSVTTSTSTSTASYAAAAASLIGSGGTMVVGATTGSGGIYGALIRALKSDGDTNVLSTPSLVTLDNEEAKFSVGQEVPFLSGSYANTGTSSVSGAVNPFQTIDRKDVGLTLSVTPQISEGDTVKLKINLEISGIASGAAGSSNLITNKRTLSNVVSVEDGQILVIGGLIDDQIQASKSSVPLLGDIPLLGGLFRSNSIKKSKQNLMLFIRPSILRQDTQIEYYSRKKYDNVRQSLIDAASGTDYPLLRSFDTWRGDRPPQTAPSAPAPESPAASPTMPPIEIAPPATPGAAAPAPAPQQAPAQAPGAIPAPTTEPSPTP
ncbi:type II secretion system secretin GspD [Solimonas variicoloris]|uniref:type II secretion system secretin GspD n=1 Tax=Solimonas variicoloris TaxID=254408 RepID=UPI00036570BD|nr:type II secretion system secretin GspD [Solimonas variicoloris]